MVIIYKEKYMCKDCGCSSTGTNAGQVFHVPGMMCENCENTVKTAALALPGVMSVDVDLKTKNVTVRFDGTKSTAEEIKEAIEDTGFDVEGISDIPHSHDGVLGVIKKIFK